LGGVVLAYGTEEDARLFANAQFRRYRELEQKYLPWIAAPAAIRAKGGKR